MAERPRQGLCFNCDEKFVRGRKCAHLFFIDYDDTPEDNITDDTATPTDDDPRISLYAVVGVPATNTVRLRVRIQDLEFLALIDSGSSHNFVRDVVVARLHLPLQPVRTGLSVIVANGDRLPCGGACADWPSRWARSRSSSTASPWRSRATTSSSARIGFVPWDRSFGISRRCP